MALIYDLTPISQVITKSYSSENPGFFYKQLKLKVMEKKIEEEKKTKNELTYEQLREFYDTSCGAWAIDRDPHEVDIDWIRENAWQLKTIDKSLLCTDCKTCPLKER